MKCQFDSRTMCWMFGSLASASGKIDTWLGHGVTDIIRVNLLSSQLNGLIEGGALLEEVAHRGSTCLPRVYLLVFLSFCVCIFPLLSPFSFPHFLPPFPNCHVELPAIMPFDCDVSASSQAKSHSQPQPETSEIVRNRMFALLSTAPPTHGYSHKQMNTKGHMQQHKTD